MVSLTLVVEKFALDRLDPIDANLEFDGTHISGVPLFDAPATDRDGIAGVLGPVGADVHRRRRVVAARSPRALST
jgi:hypothetical protein